MTVKDDSRDQGRRSLLVRPEEVEGSGYKIKTPHQDAAFYVNINHMLNPDGVLVPIEMFINSQNTESYPWIVALTRVISAVFRHNRDVSFLVDELKAVFDPHGGYYAKGRFMPSVVAEVGDCLEQHLLKIGAIVPESVSEELIAKREEAKEQGIIGGSQCSKCNQMSVVKMDGCDTCLGCGYSKCG